VQPLDENYAATWHTVVPLCDNWYRLQDYQKGMNVLLKHKAEIIPDLLKYLK